MRHFLLAALFLFPALSVARAEDGIVTIQYLDDDKKGAYRATGLLSDDAVEALQAAFPASKAHTWNTARGESINKQTAENLTENYLEVKKVLSQLQNGDVLVLNVHSSTSLIGMSPADGVSKAIPWTDFFAAYEVKTVPRLALVIINGCMEGATHTSTEEEHETLRCALNTTALVSARTTIDTLESQEELVELAGTLKNEKSAIAPSGKTFKLVVSRLVEQGKASLVDLRSRAKLTGAQSEVTKETEDRDVVIAVEDEPDPLLVSAGAPVVPWQNRAKDRLNGWTSIRFEFQPRREIERVEFVIKVHAPVSAQNDSFRGNVEGRPVHLIEKFRASKKDETIELKMAWEKRGLGGWGPKILAQLQTGKLRCVLGDDSFLEEAYVVVYYAGVKK